jgi:hypothetical protein
MKPKKILILTTGQPATNPRVVKEYLAFKQAGFETKVLYSYWTRWADSQQAELFKTYQLAKEDFILVGGHPKNQKILYFVTRLFHKLAQWVIPNSPIAITRTGAFLFVKALRLNSDLYIGHNLGALPAAVWAAKRNKAHAGFDAEDFHRGEWPIGSAMQKRVARIEQKYFPELSYFSAASPLTRERYQKLFPNVKSHCINNVFSKKDFVLRPESKEKISLVWFSQNINRGRGLELIVPSIFEKRDRFQLVLIGQLNQDFYEEALKPYVECLLIKEPMTQLKLNAEVCYYDIGLALEPGKDENNLIAISNKIWAYYQAGLFIMATDTPGQDLFLRDYPEHGVVVKRSKEEIDLALCQILKNINSIRAHKQDRFLRAQANGWESESAKLLKFVGDLSS